MTAEENKKLNELDVTAQYFKMLVNEWERRGVYQISFHEAVVKTDTKSKVVEIFVKHGLIDLLKKVADECEAEFEANRERLEAYDKLLMERNKIAFSADNEVRALDKKMEEI